MRQGGRCLAETWPSTSGKVLCRCRELGYKFRTAATRVFSVEKSSAVRLLRSSDFSLSALSFRATDLSVTGNTPLLIGHSFDLSFTVSIHRTGLVRIRERRIMLR